MQYVAVKRMYFHIIGSSLNTVYTAKRVAVRTVYVAPVGRRLKLMNGCGSTMWGSAKKTV